MATEGQRRMERPPAGQTASTRGVFAGDRDAPLPSAAVEKGLRSTAEHFQATKSYSCRSPPCSPRLFSPAKSERAFLSGPRFNLGELLQPQRPRFALPVLSCKNKSLGCPVARMHPEEPLSGRGSIALSRVNFRATGLIAHAPRGKKRRLASSGYPLTRVTRAFVP